jgi:hypothetical membrane protein
MTSDEARRMVRRRAGASLLAAGCVYLAGEAVAARAWTAPAYSYGRNWISDLGVPTAGLFHGRMVDSPLHGVMNAAFLADGLLFLLGAVLLARAAPGRPFLFLALAAAHAAGMLLVGLVPETIPAPLGSLHLLGALLAIGGGNAAIMLAPRLAGPRWAGLLLGLLGLAALLTLGFPAALAAIGGGLVERLSVYPITAWELIAGLSLLLGARPGR